MSVDLLNGSLRDMIEDEHELALRALGGKLKEHFDQEQAIALQAIASRIRERFDAFQKDVIVPLREAAERLTVAIGDDTAKTGKLIKMILDLLTRQEKLTTELVERQEILAQAFLRPHEQLTRDLLESQNKQTSEMAALTAAILKVAERPIVVDTNEIAKEVAKLMDRPIEVKLPPRRTIRKKPKWDKNDRIEYVDEIELE